MLAFDMEQAGMKKLEVILSLYFAGFKDACSVHRAYFFCRRSQKVALRTAQCLLLNGFIFLGIYFFIEKLVAPVVHWILIFPLAEEGHDESLFVESILLYLCHGLLVLPLYGLSYVASCLWYGDIAQQAFTVLEHNRIANSKEKQQKMQTTEHRENQGISGLDGILFSAGEQTYSLLVLIIFYYEVRAADYVPYIGKILVIPLRSWLYAYYFFNYKWGYVKWSLEKRLLFFETNWAFFAGFGGPCLLATFSFSGLVQEGVLAFLFPLFVLVAFGSYPERLIAAYNVGEDSQSRLPRIPMFHPTIFVVNKLFLIFGKVNGWLRRRTHAP